MGGSRSQGCHGYLSACLKCVRPPLTLQVPVSQAHLLVMSLNVAKCNLGKVRLEPMRSAVVICGAFHTPKQGGFLLHNMFRLQFS